MKKVQFGLAAVATCALAAFASADTILDHIGDMDGSAMDGSISGTQDFDAYADYDIVAMESFTIDTAMNLSSASMVLGGWNGYAGPGGITSYTVSIFSSLDAAGTSIYGDIAAISLANDFAPGVTYDADWAGQGDLVHFDMSGVSLDAGTYWIGITPANGFAANGQTGVLTSTIGNGGGAQANPAGAFGFGPYQMTGANYAYRLEGSAIPAPGAIALLGLAGIASRRRRS